MSGRIKYIDLSAPQLTGLLRGEFRLGFGTHKNLPKDALIVGLERLITGDGRIIPLNGFRLHVHSEKFPEVGPSGQIPRLRLSIVKCQGCKVVAHERLKQERENTQIVTKETLSRGVQGAASQKNGKDCKQVVEDEPNASEFPERADSNTPVGTGEDDSEGKELKAPPRDADEKDEHSTKEA